MGRGGQGPGIPTLFCAVAVGKGKRVERIAGGKEREVHGVTTCWSTE